MRKERGVGARGGGGRGMVNEGGRMREGCVCGGRRNEKGKSTRKRLRDRAETEVPGRQSSKAVCVCVKGGKGRTA